MEALGLNVTDWFILVVLTASGLISLARGFTKEFLSLFLWPDCDDQQVLRQTLRQRYRHFAG